MTYDRDSQRGRERHVLAPILALLLAPVATGTLAGQQLDARAIYEKAAPSVLVVVAYDEHRQPKALGSAFAVDDGGVVVTNFHVIDGAAAVEVKRAGEENTSPIDGLFAVSPEHDIALLKVPHQVPPLPLAGARPTVGEEIVAIGNPRGLESTLSHGIVSGIRQIGDNFELYQISAPISPGSSGGPVVNAGGRVIGVATATIRGGQNLNFAVPSSAVNALNQSRGGIKDLSKSIPGESSGAADWFKPDGEEAVRAVDLLYRNRQGRYENFNNDKVRGSIYNGTQYPIENVHVRLICHRKGVEVPIDYGNTSVPRFGSIPPGLAEPFEIQCSGRATDYELRILDYEIVR